MLLERRDFEPLAALRLSADGATLAAVTSGRLVHWSVPGGAEVASQVLAETPSRYGYGGFAISPDLRTCVRMHPGGRGITEGSVGLITLTRLGSTARQRRVAGSWIGRVAFSPDGTLLAIGRYGNRVQVWRVD